MTPEQNTTKHDVVARLFKMHPMLGIGYCVGHQIEHAIRASEKSYDWWVDIQKQMQYSQLLSEHLQGSLKQYMTDFLKHEEGLTKFDQLLTELDQLRSLTPEERLAKSEALLNDSELSEPTAEPESKPNKIQVYTPLTPLPDGITVPDGCYQLGNDDIIKEDDGLLYFELMLTNTIEIGLAPSSVYGRKVSETVSKIVFRPYPPTVTEDTRPTVWSMPKGFKRVPFGMVVPDGVAGFVCNPVTEDWKIIVLVEPNKRMFDDTYAPMCVPNDYPLKPFEA